MHFNSTNVERGAKRRTSSMDQCRERRAQRIPTAKSVAGSASCVRAIERDQTRRVLSHVIDLHRTSPVSRSIQPSTHSSRNDPTAQTMGDRPPSVPLHLTSVAILGPDNAPLYVHAFTGPEDEMRAYHLAHAAVDVIEERSEYERAPSKHRAERGAARGGERERATSCASRVLAGSETGSGLAALASLG